MLRPYRVCSLTILWDSLPELVFFCWRTLPLWLLMLRWRPSCREAIGPVPQSGCAGSQYPFGVIPVHKLALTNALPMVFRARPLPEVC